ncbi:hypothetical protein C8J57DRAFT_554718 [Mycena rebaudengoi]|nr:hypothetical protein C8J57DRAFT_554718 [Mycena rebaudengoi]
MWQRSPHSKRHFVTCCLEACSYYYSSISAHISFPLPFSSQLSPLEMPAAVALALTFGSFGDILEAARIAKRIVDLLRKGTASHGRQALVATLQGMCGDMGQMASVFDPGQFTGRLWTEIFLCHSLLEEFYTKLKSYEASGFLRLLRKAQMVAVEEKELASWRAQISERRTALHDLLLSQHGIQLHEVGEQLHDVGEQLHDVGEQLHEVGEQLGRVGSQVQYVGSRVERVEAQVENVANVGTLGVVISAHLSGQISQMGQDIREAIADVRQLPSELQRMIGNMSLDNIPEPVFFVVDPLGRSITIQLSFCHTFNDLDSILKGYLSKHPEAGGRYVNRGDYNIISTEGVVISHANLREKVKAGTHVEMSIIKRSAWRPRIRQTCPQCGQTSARATEGSWVNCAERTCGARYQISRASYEIAWAPKTEIATASMFEEIWSPQISGQESQGEFFRLVQILYRVSFLLNRCVGAT